MDRKKRNEELTPEEYRQKAEEEIQNLKKQWKTFFRTGIIIVAAVIAIIIAGIAWFVSNNRVTSTGATIQSAGSEFELAAETDQTSTGAYDDWLDVSAGSAVEVGGKNFLSTDGSHTSISWAITPDSNMKNNTDRGIEPGSGGSITFYIISHKDGPLSVTLDLALTGYKESGAQSTPLTQIDQPIQQLLEGHLLLFAGYHTESNSYSGWISEDADQWTMDLGTIPDGPKISLSREKNGKLTWSAENAAKNTAYPVKIYWIWPEMLESYLRKADGYTGSRPLLFPDDPGTTDDNFLSALPKNLFSIMSSSDGASNRYFYWEDDDRDAFKEVVTKENLSNMRKNFNPVIYGSIAAYYNGADQHLGEEVRYVKLKVDAQ